MNGRQQKVAGCAGILFVVLFAAGIVLSGNSPALNAGPAKITQYYQNHHAGILVSELLINLASIVLLWFLGGLHAHSANAMSKVPWPQWSSPREPPPWRWGW